MEGQNTLTPGTGAAGRGVMMQGIVRVAPQGGLAYINKQIYIYIYTHVCVRIKRVREGERERERKRKREREAKVCWQEAQFWCTPCMQYTYNTSPHPAEITCYSCYPPVCSVIP